MAYKIYVEKQGASYPYDIEHHKGSLPELPSISTKMKPIEEDKANAELEKGEIILDPKTGTLHKALGKPHSKGGTPVSLKEGSFIFSNFKDLAINKDEKELFEFKLGGKYKAKNNTPSKILEKEVDLEHHNKMIDILENEKKHTKETVNSAKLMMLKNLEKAGQLAFLQESKKNTEVPEFAKQTAPVYSKQTDEQINQSMQYLQKGGYSLPKYQVGNNGKPLTAEEILKAEQNLLTDVNGWKYRWKDGRKVYYDKPGSFTQRQKPTKEQTQQFNTWFAKQTPQYQQNYISQSKKVMSQTPGQLGYTREPLKPVESYRGLQIPPSIMLKPKPPSFVTKQTGNAAGNPQGIVDPTNYDTKLTPWQKINIGIPFYRALNVKTQYPLRQHQESVIPQMDNINVQPQLDQNNQSYFNAAQQTRGLVPGQAGAYMQQLFGNRIAANNQAIGNTQNANVQIQNQQKAMAATSLNNDAVQNRAFDLKYYDQVQTAVKNTDELKQAYTQQGINNLNETMTKKLAFDSWLNTQQQYRGKPTYVDQDGIQHYEGQALYTPKAGFWGNSIQHNPANIDWSTYERSQTSMEDDDASYVKSIRELLPGISEDKIGDLLRERTKKKTLAAYSAANIKTQNIPPFKLGGKYR